MKNLFAALEAGGTKMVCAIVAEDGEVVDKKTIPTTTVEETLNAITDYFRGQMSIHEIKALGIGTFGPVELHKESDEYGNILNTPKAGWKGAKLLTTLKENLGIPVFIDTDVNCSCLGETTFGKYSNCKNLVYITIGTGIGAGFLVEGNLVHGALHPETGHMLLSREREDSFKSVCPYHDNCFEGLASGPAIELRCGKKAEFVEESSPVWEREAFYIAQALVNIIMTTSPEKIILGGGVMHKKFLYPMIRRNVIKLVGGYLNIKELENIDNYIVEPSLGEEQGILGATALIHMGHQRNADGISTNTNP